MAINVRRYKTVTYIPKEIGDVYSLLLSLWVGLFFSVPWTHWSESEGCIFDIRFCILWFASIGLVFGFVLVTNTIASYGHRSGSWFIYAIVLCSCGFFGLGLHYLLIELSQTPLKPWEELIVWVGPSIILYKILAFEIFYGINSFSRRKK